MVGITFSNKCLKSKELTYETKINYMLVFIMINDFRFDLGIFTTHLKNIIILD